MEPKITRTRIRIAAELEPDLLALVDEECRGLCSRAMIIRLALLDRYGVRRNGGRKLSGRREVA